VQVSLPMDGRVARFMNNDDRQARYYSAAEISSVAPLDRVSVRAQDRSYTNKVIGRENAVGSVPPG
jgi:hypothetical protein